MIQKEQGLIEKIVGEMPMQSRPNLSDVFSSPGGKSSQNMSLFFCFFLIITRFIYNLYDDVFIVNSYNRAF